MGSKAKKWEKVWNRQINGEKVWIVIMELLILQHEYNDVQRLYRFGELQR
jgi:hypothetical protein